METNRSVIKSIRDRLLSGAELTSCGAAKEFLTGDLRKYVSNLRKDGIPISDRWETSTNGKRYKVYYCKPEDRHIQYGSKRPQDTQKQAPVRH